MRYLQNIRLLRSLALTCVLATAYVGFAAPPDKAASEIKADSVWSGTCSDDTDSQYPMILFIRTRNGDRFEGTTWYPTSDNGLIAISGQIIDDATITFNEDKVIHEGNVMTGSRYTAVLRGKSLTGNLRIAISPTKVGAGNIS